MHICIPMIKRGRLAFKELSLKRLQTAPSTSRVETYGSPSGFSRFVLSDGPQF